MDMDIFYKLKDCTFNFDDKRYSVLPLLTLPHKVGYSVDGFVKIFISTIHDGALIKNINAEILSVEYDVICNVLEGESKIDNQQFTIITLRSGNEQLQKIFIDVFTMMLKSLPSNPSKEMIACKVENLLSIFSKLKKQPIHKIQGLWAELLLIDQSIDPELVARSWHYSPDAKYDFSLGADKVEVKSTSSENRIHGFSIDQLNPTQNSNLLICSILVRESGEDKNGLSVFDLYNRIASRIQSDEIRFHVYDVIIQTLGTDFYNAGNKYFDYITACDSLALYDYKDVPRINKLDIPDHVLNVRFNSDLSHLQDIRDFNANFDPDSLFYALFKVYD